MYDGQRMWPETSVGIGAVTFRKPVKESYKALMKTGWRSVRDGR